MKSNMKMIVIGIFLILTLLIFTLPENKMNNNTSNQAKLPSIDKNQTEATKTATFALRCFWGVEARFGVIPGVVRTQVGYTGGNKTNPTYKDLGEHTETVQVVYNPEEVSYEQLLQVFWDSHDPTVKAVPTQYESIIFYHNEEQKDAAIRSKNNLKLDENIQTDIRPLREFYLAEEYHQKYYLKSNKGPVWEEFAEMYPNSSFLNSTAATKVNGFIAGYGSHEVLERNIDDFGLSEEAEEELLSQFENRYRNATCGFN